MHTFYESVGFSKIVDAGEIEKLMRDTVMHFDKRTIFKNERDSMCGEFVKNYADHMGLTVVGEFDREGNFHPGYVFPFFYAKTVSGSVRLSFSICQTLEITWYTGIKMN